MPNPWDFSGALIAADEAKFRDRQYAEGQALRNLQLEDLRYQMKERQGLQDFRAGWNPYLEQNRSLLEPTTIESQQPLSQPEIEASVGTGVGPRTTRDVTTTIPAKESVESLYGQYALKSGRPDIAIPMLKEARIEKQGANKERIKMKLDFLKPVVTGLIEQGNDEGFKNVLKSMSQDPDLGEFAGQMLDANMTLTGKNEYKSTRMVKAGTLKDPVTGEFIPEGMYELEFRGTGENGQLLSYKPAKDDKKTVDRFEPYGHGMMWDKVEQKLVKVPVAPEKPDKPEKPTTFDKKMALTEKAFIDKNKRKPKPEEIIEEYKKQWGPEDLLSGLLGAMGVAAPVKESIKPEPVKQKLIYKDGKLVPK